MRRFRRGGGARSEVDTTANMDVDGGCSGSSSDTTATDGNAKVTRGGGGIVYPHTKAGAAAAAKVAEETAEEAYLAVQAADPSTGVWSAVADMNTARYGHGVTVVDGKLYAAGGKNDDDDAFSSVECFDPSTGQWSVLADMNTSRAFVPIVALE